MWIFTDTGFISAVRKPEYPTVFTVRSRDRKSLESLAAKAQVDIKKSPRGDYPYRLFVDQNPFIEWFLDRSEELEYSNFKNRVTQTRGIEFGHALSNVWIAMLSVEDAEARIALQGAAGDQSVTECVSSLTDLSVEEQIVLSEKAHDRPLEKLFESEKRETTWSEESGS